MRDGRVRVEFRILGALEAVVGREELSLGSVQQRAVLALLLVRAPEPVSRDRLIDGLWGERPPASAAHALQVYASGIREALRPAGDAVAVRSSPAGYVLEVEAERVDARRFERLIEKGQGVLGEDPAGARELFERALGLWRGRPLAEFEQFEWARRESDRLEELRELALEGLVEARLAGGEHGEVIGTLSGLVATSPLREGPRRLLMLALYRAGRHAEALAAYRDACAALDEIGLQPGPELRVLEQAILRHDEALTAPAAPARDSPGTRDAGAEDSDDGVDLRRSSLPVAANPLVGRSSEISAVATMLARSDARLVTLLGPGGSGKTRLALEIATQLTMRYRDGAWFVSLAQLSDPGLVPLEIIHTLGLNETESQTAPIALAAALERRELLLVLDNFEHLIASAQLVCELLAAAPGLRVLVTSREALNVSGETRVEVGGLPLPDAAELFLARARAVRADATDGVGQDAVIERICRRLDGLPLALELAAARAAVFSIPALEARLAQRLELPVAARDLPDRQRTLGATMDWSYSLLTARERALLRGLSVFAGGARLESIESVLAETEASSIETVASLVDKSLLRRRDDPDGQTRFWMLQTIREYAFERLTDEREAAAAAARHAAYFLTLAEEVEPLIHTRAQSAWLARLEADHDNLRAAFEFQVKHNPSAALRIAAALGQFWETHGHLTEGRERLQRVLATPQVSNARAAAKATFHAGHLAYLQGEGQAVEPLQADALRLAREASDVRIEVQALSFLGMLAAARGDVGLSIELTEQALSIARQVHDDWLLCGALNMVAIANDGSGDIHRTRAIFEEALDWARRLGDPRGITNVAGNIAECALSEEDLDGAEQMIAESLKHAREIDYATAIARGHCLEAILAVERADLDSADARLIGTLKFVRAAYDVVLGRRALAAAATLATARGQPLLAAQLWAALESEISRQEVVETSLVTHLRDRWLPKARHSVNPAAWKAAWARGTELRPEQALDLALATLQ